MRNLHTTTKSSPLLAATREKRAAQRRPSTAKINKQKMSGILPIWEALPMLGLRSRSAVTWGRWIQTLVGHSALLHLAPPHQFWVPGSHTCPHHSLSPSAWSLWVCVFFTPAAGKARDRDVVDYQDNSHRSVKKRVSLLPRPLGGWPRMGWYLSSEGPMCSALQPGALDCAPHRRLFVWALILLVSKLISPWDAGTKTLWSQDIPPQAYMLICYTSYRMESILGDHQNPRELSPWHDTPPPITLLRPACSQQESPSLRKWMQGLRAISPEILRYRLQERWHLASDKRNVPTLRDREVILAYPWVHLNSTLISLSNMHCLSALNIEEEGTLTRSKEWPC